MELNIISNAKDLIRISIPKGLYYQNSHEQEINEIKRDIIYDFSTTFYKKIKQHHIKFSGGETISDFIHKINHKMK